MFHKLSDDLIQYIFTFFDLYLIHDIKYIKEKIISVELNFLRQINHIFNNNIELYFKNKLKNVFVINNPITNHYNNVLERLYFDEIIKIGRIKMFEYFSNNNK